MKVIDISYHQGTINWNKVAKTDVTGVLIRAGYGKGNVDKQFVKNINNAIEAGIEHIGAYWFSYAYTVDMAINEAKYIANLLFPYRDKIDLGVYFDWEYDSMKNAKKNGAIMNKNKITSMNLAFCQAIESLGYIAGYYVNEDYQKNYVDTNALSQYRKWYSRYSSKAKPINAYLWQYSSKGKVNGINTNVDMNKLLNPLTIEEIALEVIDGKWGNGVTRKNKLESAGYNYRLVQDKVNEILKQRS